jgi:hypothetical protein
MTAQADELPGVTPAPKPQGITAATIREALERHYRKPGAPRDGEILIPEVSAPGSNRRADLVRVGMWASRGTGIDVHEIKVSRGDWLRELDEPAKAEAWWPYCNRFWVVAPPGVARVSELPEGWGLLELPASGRRFKVVVKPATRTDVRLTVPLLVELLRRADNQRLGEIDQLRHQHRNEMHKLAESWRAKKAVGELPREVRGRLDLLKAVEEALGMPLDEFGGWPKNPPQAIAPEELAAYLADAGDHVTVQRRADDVRRREDILRRAASRALEQLGGAARGPS